MGIHAPTLELLVCTWQPQLKLLTHAPAFVFRPLVAAGAAVVETF